MARRDHHRHRLGAAEQAVARTASGAIQMLDRNLCNTAMLEARADGP